MNVVSNLVDNVRYVPNFQDLRVIKRCFASNLKESTTHRIWPCGASGEHRPVVLAAVRRNPSWTWLSRRHLPYLPALCLLEASPGFEAELGGLTAILPRVGWRQLENLVGFISEFVPKSMDFVPSSFYKYMFCAENRFPNIGFVPSSTPFVPRRDRIIHKTVGPKIHFVMGSQKPKAFCDT